MPYLGDYIGQLLSEITMARAQADHATMRLAEVYAGDPYLKNMPVPRFRLPTVTLDVPVAVHSTEEVGELGQAKQAPAVRSRMLIRMRDGVDQVLRNQCERAGVRLSAESRRAVGAAAAKVFSGLRRDNGSPIRLAVIADRIAETLIDVLTSLSHKQTAIPEGAVRSLAEDLPLALQSEFTKYLGKPSRIKALVTTAELREIGPADILARIHLTISEQGVEWTSIESDKGLQKRRLVPE
jgi:hypothetical protein